MQTGHFKLLASGAKSGLEISDTTAVNFLLGRLMAIFHPSVISLNELAIEGRPTSVVSSQLTDIRPGRNFFHTLLIRLLT